MILDEEITPFGVLKTIGALVLDSAHIVQTDDCTLFGKGSEFLEV